MHIFKDRHFNYKLIIWAVRWYCKYGIRYKDLEEMLTELLAAVDHFTIYRCVQSYELQMFNKPRWYWKTRWGFSWKLDKIYIKVKDKCSYLYRAIDKRVNTVDFYLSKVRNINSARTFLRKAFRSIPYNFQPISINTDKSPIYVSAIVGLQSQGYVF